MNKKELLPKIQGLEFQINCLSKLWTLSGFQNQGKVKVNLEENKIIDVEK